MITKSFQFDLGQKVKIKEINRVGTIVGLLVDLEAICYKVSYWDNCSRKVEWLYDFDIENKE